MDYGNVGASGADAMFESLVAGEELVGEDEIVGLEEIVGAAAAHKLVRKVQPNRKRRLMSGVTPTSVAAAATADISTQPQDLFRIERVIVPSDIAFSFIFTDIKVGQRSQFVAAASIPCGAFTETSVDSYVSFDTANVGNLVVLSVQNVSSPAATLTFRAMLLGTAAI